MNAGPYIKLLTLLNKNWHAKKNDFSVEIADKSIGLDSLHPLHGEISALCGGQSASLPFFTEEKITWCTIASDGASLRSEISNLRAWVLTSFGTEDGGLTIPTVKKTTPLLEQLSIHSPGGYFRWKCSLNRLPTIIDRLKLLHALKSQRPQRTSRVRTTLYQLRVDFSSALLVGNRLAAEHALDRIEEMQLDTATNALFLKIKLWHHFREFERIKNHPDIERLYTQPMPPSVRLWLQEAGTQLATHTETPPLEVVPEPISPETPEAVWGKWLESVRDGDAKMAESILSERIRLDAATIGAAALGTLVGILDEIYTDDALRMRERHQIAYGISEILRDFVREPEFPRSGFATFYLAFYRVWGSLYSGISTSREHGSVLLELASAALRLNQSPHNIVPILESWWRARPSRAQLPMLLDCVELLTSELPDPTPALNLWIEGADTIKKAPGCLSPSEAAIWRSCGVKLQLDPETIAEYLPKTSQKAESDILSALEGKHIAIVCMRTRQAKDAAEKIAERTTAKVSIVDCKSAGPETNHAVTADVVLFVWMATSHSVFRAFDKLDRDLLCYVQGTGPSSIVRALERWVTTTMVGASNRTHGG